MSAPSVIVVPGPTDGTQQPGQDPAELVSKIERVLSEESHPNGEEEKGPLKELIAHQDSLYRYLSWEDPVRTLGSYLAALSVLFGAHYLPLTYWVVKAGAAVFGFISLSEIVGRNLGYDSFLSRLRPSEYKTVPEPVLNATLKDIHDFTQYSAIQVQRIIFGEDLGKAFAAFTGFTALYLLMHIASPFSLAVLGLTSLYVAPLVASPHGRAVAKDATEQGQRLANTAAEKAGVLAEDTKARAADLSVKTRETAGTVQESSMDKATDVSRATSEKVAKVQQGVGNLAQSGKETVSDLSSQARQKATDVSRATGEKVANLKDMGVDAANKAPGLVSTSTERAANYTHRSIPGTVDEGTQNYRHDAGAARTIPGTHEEVSHSYRHDAGGAYSNEIYETPRQMRDPGTADTSYRSPATSGKRGDVAFRMSAR
ncbi:hypothetical protein NW752_000087 [Fusarium irregulare]|uniref:Reticulon domain-containing protein n=1 Tax=Fusarium irregulare TaxID=2494466 RepID=A0A9W8PZ81_9HYPO|nr:hypothetical protein NW766_001750 [Fusarium irregulare]KAJ4027842.1 hypothetical protein NW752_000087 [Fusarium irregulare]